MSARRTMDELATYAEASVALAKKAGAPEALTVMEQRREVRVTWRDGALAKATEATTRQLTLRIYADGRYLRVATGDLRPAALRSLIGEALATAKLLQPDGYGGVWPAAYYKSGAPVDLELADPAQPSLSLAARRHRLATEEAAARDAAGKAIVASVTVEGTDSLTEQAFAVSNGATGAQKMTQFTLTADVTARDGAARLVDGEARASARFSQDLPPAGALGRQAATRALARRGAVKGLATPATVVIENAVAENFLVHLMRPLQSLQLALGQSCYQQRLHQPIASPLLNLFDEPWLTRGLASTRFDDFGMATKPMTVVREGVLQNFYIDGYFGHKLGMAPTSSAPTNLRWGLGGKSAAELIAEVGHGLLVTGFLGGNSNDSTGDFSLGVEGFMLRHGAIAEPVHEMNLAGNHLTFWSRLTAVGNDPFPHSAWCSPTLLFEGRKT